MGAGNYARAAADPDVAIALWNTAYYSFIIVPLDLMVALGLALLLNQPLRGISVFRTIFYMPALVGGVATIMMWIWIFNPEVRAPQLGAPADPGTCSRRVGLDQADNWPLPKWIFSDLWAQARPHPDGACGGTGASMLIFLAALQNVPESLYEAAELDGAGAWRKFAFVTVPQISPALFFNLVMGIIGSFQVFTQAFLMTEGGPNKATLFYVLYLYNKAFGDFEIGYASALSWILFVIIMAFTALVFRSSRIWVYYEGEGR